MPRFEVSSGAATFYILLDQVRGRRNDRNGRIALTPAGAAQPSAA